MKKLNKLSILLIGLVLGILISISGVYAYNMFSKDISFTPSNPDWEVDNVESAINDLYEESKKSATMIILINYKNSFGEIDLTNLGYKTFKVTNKSCSSGNASVGTRRYTGSAYPVERINLNQEYPIDKDHMRVNLTKDGVEGYCQAVINLYK